MKKTIAFLLVSVLLSSCDLLQQAAGTYQLTQCKYDYNSISGLSLAGINLQNITDISSLNPLSAAKLLTAFSSSSGNLPLDFTLNLDVTNPGIQTAILNGLNYVLVIDGIEMTQGFFDKQLKVGSGEKNVLPIRMAFDLKKVLSGSSMEAIKNLAFNFAGIGNGSSGVTIKLKPNFIVGGQTISAPAYIPVSFTLKR
jgi:LEA14-like dessication related protein